MKLASDLSSTGLPLSVFSFSAVVNSKFASVLKKFFGAFTTNQRKTKEAKILKQCSTTLLILVGLARVIIILE